MREEPIFHKVLEQAPDRREAFLDAACGGDPELRERVALLLRAEENPKSFLQSPIVCVSPTIAPSTESIGTLIGPYKLLEQIGEGGMGLVYMAEQQRPVRRLVALKIIKPGMDSKQVIARFEAERQALAMMDHQNIAKVLDAGTTEVGRPYFVMELVRGIPINQLCDEKRLAVRQRLELFIQVCQAVQHAHQKGIIHRDLKPTNVLVTMNDATPLPKVIDFGIAKALGAQLTEHTLHTGFAQLVGTPLYMSPEQAEMNHLGVDTRSDVYSLGVILYELLTGTTPFDKETLTKAGFDEMRRIIREQEPLRPSARVSTLEAQALSTISERRNTDARRITITLNGELDWIVMKALAKDRSERYESASSLAKDIERYLTGDLVQACPPSTAYRFLKFSRKHRAVFTTTAIVAASLLIGTTVSAWQAIRATAAEAQATANEAKAKSEEQKATALAQAEATQRQRAEASEQQAKDRLVEVEQQRKQAEKNFEAALEAVDRMLVNVGDPELNDVPRVGPLRRKMLKDVIAFYERIPPHSGLSADTRFRVAETWNQIAYLSSPLNEFQQALHAWNIAIASLETLVAEHPTQTKYRATLARVQLRAAGLNYDQLHDYVEAEKLSRRSSELFGELAHSSPTEKSWPKAQVDSLHKLSVSLAALRKRDEAIGVATRALDVLDKLPDANSYDRAQILYSSAVWRSSTAEMEDQHRRAIAEYRKFFSTEEAKTQYGDYANYAGRLLAICAHWQNRHPDEAEKILDESIAIWTDVLKSLPSQRNNLHGFIESLLAQARLQRRLAATRSSTEEADKIAARVVKAEHLFQEAITAQRQTAARFALPEDKFGLANMLQEESEYLLSKAAADQPEDFAARKIRADALLTEAIQLCRALTAEYPENADYKSHLAALLKLQAQHFGQKDTPNP